MSVPLVRFDPGGVLAAVAILALAGLIVAPGADLAVSSWFYQPGAGFPLADLPFFRFVMKALPDLEIGVTAIVAVFGIAGAATGRIFLGITPRIALFLASSLIVGPGLLANTLFKDHWGRARPHQIVEFGGSAHFSPAVILGDQCARNCSFPSGHAALAFWLLAFAAVVPSRWQTPVSITALAVGVLIGIMRIAQGGHFLSDVIAAALLVVAVNHLLKKLILDRTVT